MNYKVGDYIIVEFGGRKGDQLAKIGRVLDGGYKVWKWRAQSKRWTGLVAVADGEVKGSGTMRPDLMRAARVTHGRG